MGIFSKLSRGLAAMVMAHVLCLAPFAAHAQSNSSQAAEAARKHRAEQAQNPGRAAPARSSAQRNTPAPQQNAYRSSANPHADPNASLKSCMDHAGMNPLARDRCMRQHCEGKWGQGDCPASGGDFMANKNAGNTPLGRCLKEAGSNPFKRDACGWSHCRDKWDTDAACAAIKPRNQPLAN